MNITKTMLLTALLFSATAGATEQTVVQDKDITTAQNVLRVDGISDARVVEILNSGNPFVFTYCRKSRTNMWRRKAYPSLWKYEVTSSKAPDVRDAEARVTKYQEIENNSALCAEEK